MSYLEKVGIGQLVTILGTCAGVLIMIGSYKHQLESCQQDVSEMKVVVDRIARSQERMEERSVSTAAAMVSLESRVHGLSSKVGQVGSQVLKIGGQ